ncbi:MAG: HAD hydrolase family protein, partial [Treponema sp.]|nr:HAD hydrolase family protein [Treponema sp.]
WLANHLGIEKSQTMGFGDSMNDESMIRLLEYGVCMANGNEQIKQIADYVTEKTNDESGVADFILKNVNLN